MTKEMFMLEENEWTLVLILIGWLSHFSHKETDSLFSSQTKIWTRTKDNAIARTNSIKPLRQCIQNSITKPTKTTRIKKKKCVSKPSIALPLPNQTIQKLLLQPLRPTPRLLRIPPTVQKRNRREILILARGQPVGPPQLMLLPVPDALQMVVHLRVRSLPVVARDAEDEVIAAHPLLHAVVQVEGCFGFLPKALELLGSWGGGAFVFLLFLLLLLGFFGAGG